MHSRIFQLERSRENISRYPLEEYRFDYDGIHAWFIDRIADYVNEDTNQQEDIRWFLDNLENCREYFVLDMQGTEVVSITFLQGFKRAFFGRRFDTFKRDVANMKLDDFINSMGLITIQSTIEEEFGFYVCIEDSLITMDSFIRHLPNEDTTYYFGATIDYHWQEGDNIILYIRGGINE